MRLICPNCDAHYEVPDAAIPPEGRDVQCSNCETTWFFKPEAVSDTVGAEFSDVSDAVPEAAFDPEEPAQEESLPAPRRRLDPEVVNVLREEAAYEARARAVERNTLETQPELGLLPAESPEAMARRRMAAAQAGLAQIGAEAVPGPDGAPIPAPATGQAGPGAHTPIDTLPQSTRTAGPETARRDLLPDVEDISATLSSRKDRAEADAAFDGLPIRGLVEPDGRPWGFLLVIALAAIAVSAYLLAPQASARVPALAAPLESYVSTVETGRVWLDGQVLRGLAWLDGLRSGAPTANGG